MALPITLIQLVKQNLPEFTASQNRSCQHLQVACLTILCESSWRSSAYLCWLTAFSTTAIGQVPRAFFNVVSIESIAALLAVNSFSVRWPAACTTKFPQPVPCNLCFC